MKDNYDESEGFRDMGFAFAMAPLLYALLVLALSL